MQIEHMPINFEDARGYIRDIIVAKEVDSVSLITCAPGAVRGNHFHKQTIQYTYVLSGRLTYATQKPDQPMETKEVVEGDLTANPPLESHAFKAIEQSTGDLLAILGEWFEGTHGIRLYREEAAQKPRGEPQERAKRITDDMVKSERLNALRKKDASLDAAIEVVDLEIDERDA